MACPSYREALVPSPPHDMCESDGQNPVKIRHHAIGHTQLLAFRLCCSNV